MPLASLLSSILPIYCVSQKCSMRKPTIGRLGLGHTWFLEELLKRKWARWEHNLSLLLSVQLDQPKPTILKPNIHSKLGNFCTPTWHLEGKNPTSWNFVYLPSYHTLKLLSYCEHKVYDTHVKHKCISHVDFSAVPKLSPNPPTICNAHSKHVGLGRINQCVIPYALWPHN